LVDFVISKVNCIRIKTAIKLRQRLLRIGASELKYEIRGIVEKAERIKANGQEILWENIGDPIQKHCQVPEWMKDTIKDLLSQNDTYGYSHSKGVPETRKFLAERTNELNGVQITFEDILFFNGLGDAISKIYDYILPTSRIIGPSPAYSTHSSAEAAHANHEPITYKLDPKNSWYPDLDDLHNKIKYNPSIVGILIINPDNPTGMVYPEATLRRIVEIAEEFDLFLISDEIYQNITYNNTTVKTLAEVIGKVPGIAMKGISKEFPWPGARCGWIEFYNRNSDEDFDMLCKTLENAKMIEVCSTKLPQLAIPKIMKDERYPEFRISLNNKIGKRSDELTNLLGDIKEVYFNPTFGAFYNTIVFKEGVLNNHQTMEVSNEQNKLILDEWINQPSLEADSRFVYHLLAAKGVCVVPISSFCSELQGFRVTLLEEDEALFTETFKRIREGIIEYVR
jgi:aspartate/methionine/tyrosine aminotransferase